MDTEFSEEIRIESEVLGNEGADEQTTTVEELLIACVMARPPLWDSRIPLKERSKAIRDKLCLEIHEEFGGSPEYSVEFLIKKWRNLRDTYVRIKGEYTPSGSAAKKKRKWEFFEQMTFLNETISYRPTVSNVLVSPSTSSVTSPLTSPSVYTEVSDGGGTSKRKEANMPLQKMESAIIETLNKINAPPPEAPAPNPICMRISEMLNQMPQMERTCLEIKLLQVAYDGAKDFL